MSVSPPRPKGPPLNAMRAFEAAARTRSFVTAADELGVTPAAISQHVKAIEAWAECALFKRNPQGVVLTPEGRSLIPDFVTAFDAIGAATQSLRTLRPEPEVHIATLPSIAQLWLPRRLARLRNRLPDCKFSVTALETPPNMDRELFDLSLFFLPEAEADADTVICPDIIYPVCAPSMLPQLASTGGLDSLPLLHDRTWSDDWELWSRAAGASLADPTAGPRYSLYSLAVEEAKSGAGVLIGHACLVEDALAQGTLVRPFDPDCTTGRVLSLSRAKRARPSPELELVAATLRE